LSGDQAGGPHAAIVFNASTAHLIHQAALTPTIIIPYTPPKE
jgi:hypothetical protein